MKKYSPVQWNRHSAQPCTKHSANQSSVDFINRQKQRDNLPPGLAVYTVYVYQGQCTEKRDVSAAKESMPVMRGDGRAEEDEGSGQERGCSDQGKKEG